VVLPHGAGAGPLGGPRAPVGPSASGRGSTAGRPAVGRPASSARPGPGHQVFSAVGSPPPACGWSPRRIRAGSCDAAVWVGRCAAGGTLEFASSVRQERWSARGSMRRPVGWLNTRPWSARLLPATSRCSSCRRRCSRGFLHQRCGHPDGRPAGADLGSTAAGASQPDRCERHTSAIRVPKELQSAGVRLCGIPARHVPLVGMTSRGEPEIVGVVSTSRPVDLSRISPIDPLCEAQPTLGLAEGSSP
jgi:hypothetical protein